MKGRKETVSPVNSARSLTRAEEQVMQALWKQQSGYLKDVVDAMPPPIPHSNTVATLLKILIDKGFVVAESSGRNNLYRPVISKEDYSRSTIGNIVSHYFNGSFKEAVSFLVDQNQISVDDLELLLKQLKQK